MGKATGQVASTVHVETAALPSKARLDGRTTKCRVIDNPRSNRYEVVGQFAKPFTTRITKVHEGNPEEKAFVTLRALGGSWVLGFSSSDEPLLTRKFAQF